MSSETTLVGKNIVVTRPLAQARNILELLEIRQAKVVHFPVIRISVSDNIELAKKCFSNLSNYHIIIFISTNAVHYAMSTARELDINFSNSTLAAVGQATKVALETYSCNVEIVPVVDFNSEALLHHSALQNITEKNILIVRGNGGREHLRKTLESRNAQVEYAEVYKRQLPSERNNINLAKLPKHDTAILLYSIESAHNLWSLCTQEEQQWLKNSTLITGSKRIAEAITKVGIAKNYIIAENPSDEAMLAAISAWS